MLFIFYNCSWQLLEAHVQWSYLFVQLRKKSFIQFHVQKRPFTDHLLFISCISFGYKHPELYQNDLEDFCLTYLRFIVPIIDIIFHIGDSIFLLHASIDIWYGIFYRRSASFRSVLTRQLEEKIKVLDLSCQMHFCLLGNAKKWDICF